MAKIVAAPYGSLGDLHPMLALAVELRRRGHSLLIAAPEVYREKIDSIGFDFNSLRPHVDPEDRDLLRETMDPKTGTERIIKDLMMANLRPMFDDLMGVCRDADILIAGEIVYPARSVAEKLGIKWVTTSLAPISMFSTYEPTVYPNAQFLKYLSFAGRPVNLVVHRIMRQVISGWTSPYRKFRRELGLSEEHDPIVNDKYSNYLHLALFSKALGRPQPDWHPKTVQTGFCFYDGKEDIGHMPVELLDFLDSGEPPLVFTLGSAAVMDPGDFFEQSIQAAKILNRRALFLYGIYNEKPNGFDDMRVGFDYAPYSEVFPRSACVIHQGGVGTKAQALRAGVPHFIMPYSHDQPDNAARCERMGVARSISRAGFNAKNASIEIAKLLKDESYKANALEAKRIVDSETGTETACDAIEIVLENENE